MNKFYSLLSMLCLVAANTYAETPQPPTPSEPDGIIGGHEYVDLGLPSGTLWATYNVGASSPYEKGQYFAWGETEPREDFSWESYRFFEGHEVDPNNGEWAVLENIGTDICGTEYDAARYQWGNGWRLPNEQERYELLMLCWTNGSSVENGVRGVRLYGPNEHSIFLPICGYGLWYGDLDPFHNTSAAYLTGVENPECGYNGRPIEPSNRAKGFIVERDAGLTGATCNKAYGSNIRAVVNPKESGVNPLVYDRNSITISFQNGNIIVSGTDNKCTLELFDLSGRIIISATVDNGICPLPSLSNGIYLVTVTDGASSKTQKVAIK